VNIPADHADLDVMASPKPPPRAHGEDDAGFLVRLQRGDDHAAEQLVRRHAGAMLATIRRLLGSSGDAGEVLQEAFRTVFAAVATLARNVEWSGWFRGHAIRAALARLGAVRAPAAGAAPVLLPRFHDDGTWCQPVGSAPAVSPAAVPGTGALLRHGIERLPAEQRATLKLCDGERLGREEAAAMLGVSQATVALRLRQARMAMCALLDGSRGALAS
jgi:DNA-directed RNA polymerase specialized sigma24 family protein